MLKSGHRSIMVIITVITLSTCIDPYTPALKGYNSMLVVEGLITDENTSYTVRLTRTMEENTNPPFVTNAAVFITDNTGNRTFLNSRGYGIYKTDSTVFTGKIGNTYTLNVITREGEIYESDRCLMQPVQDIDSIYFIKDQELVNNGTEADDGIRIFLDSETGGENKYYRWSFEETWKYRIPSPQRFTYVNNNSILPVANVKQYCWKSSKSQQVLVHSLSSDGNGRIVKEPILFVATDKSDRLMLQYSILVKQYSLSKNEYDFWENMKRVNESGGDIFAAIPFSVTSNIHNINNPEEKVLGYFQVSAVTQKRKYILFNDIYKLRLPVFRNMCERIEASPGDFKTGAFDPTMSWDELYEMFCVQDDYSFVEPVYSETHILEKLVFAKPECANCGLTGTSVRPAFWPASD